MDAWDGHPAVCVRRQIGLVCTVPRVARHRDAASRRVSYEKNIEALLKLDIPSTKVMCGVGSRDARVKQGYRQVR